MFLNMNRKQVKFKELLDFQQCKYGAEIHDMLKDKHTGYIQQG